MRMKALIGTVVVAAALVLTSCAAQTGGSGGMDPGDASSGTGMESDDTSMESGDEGMESDDGGEGSMMTALGGTFEGLNDKSVSGTAEITEEGIDLAGFASDEGPDLHLYLTDGTDEMAVSSGVELGVVAFDESSQTFTVEDGVDPAQYTHLVVHCDKARAVFGAAELS